MNDAGYAATGDAAAGDAAATGHEPTEARMMRELQKQEMQQGARRMVWAAATRAQTKRVIQQRVMQQGARNDAMMQQQEHDRCG